MKGRAAQGAPCALLLQAEVDGHPISLLISDRTPQASDNHEVLAAVVPAKSDQDDETPPQDGVGEISKLPKPKHQKPELRPLKDQTRIHQCLWLREYLEDPAPEGSAKL